MSKRKLRDRITDLVVHGTGNFNGKSGPYHTGEDLPSWDREILDLLEDIIDALPDDE